MTNDSFVAVILCGGSGSRLWPLSRAEYAKPFVQLPGLSASLLQETYRRLPIGNATPAANCPPCAAVITVAAADNIFLCQQAAADCSGAEMLFIGEPVGRNTAPALAAAARWVAEKFGDDMRLLALPADHLVGKPAAFWDAAAKALAAAKNGFALLGITPDHPATGYGYMECGEVLDSGCFAVRQFIEKPDSATAAKFLSAGNFLWNAGVFCFTPKTLFAEMRQHAPQLLSSLTAMNPPPRSANEWLPAAEEYAAFPNISFDYALMEKTQNASVAAAADAQWSDVGSWAALQEHIAADANGNRIVNMPAVSNMLDIESKSNPNQNEDNNALLQDSKNCFVVSAGGRLVTGVGLEDLHIIDTPDALLISAAAKSQEVRKIYDTLQTQKRRQATTPTTVHRPWGFYTVLAESPNHKVKRITVNPGGILSLQSHNHRSEHWTTVQGVMSVVINEQEFDMPLDKSCHIPLGAKHRMQNKTDSAASIIEVQIGDYLGEDDIIRYEDIYGRVPNKS